MIEVEGHVRAHPGLHACGDAWTRVDREDGVLLAIVDGLGHGRAAAAAAATAVAALHADAARPGPCDLAGLLLAVHAALRDTRGAVAGVALLDPATGQVRYAGVGNTEVRLFGAGSSPLFSRPGLLGGERLQRPVVQHATLPVGALLVLHSDGLRPIEDERAPVRLPCAELVRHWLERRARDDDDAGLVVARRGGTT